MATIEVLNPVAASAGATAMTDPAPRPSTLDSKKLGIWWNYKPGGKEVLYRVADRLRERFTNITFVELFGTHMPASRETVDRALRECEAIIAATGD